MTEQFDDIYGGKYLAAADIKAPRVATIQSVTTEEFSKPGEPSRRKAIIAFVGGRKAMVVNKTNALMVAAAFGKDMAGWAGKKVRIQSETVNFGGKQMPGLRIYPVAAAPAPAPAPVVPAGEFEDEIPW